MKTIKLKAVESRPIMKKRVSNYSLLDFYFTLMSQHNFSFRHSLRWLRVYTRSIQYALLLICLSYSPCAFSQDQSDSLYQVYQNSELPDTTRLWAYYSFINDYVLYSNPEKAAEHSLVLLEKSKKANFPGGVSAAYNLIGSVRFIQGDYAEALEQFKQKLEFDKKEGDKTAIAGTLGNIGVVLNNMGDYLQAMRYFEQSYDLQKILGNKAGMSTALSNIGLIYFDKGDYPRALSYYEKAMLIEEEIGDERGAAGSLINIGNMYLKSSEFEKAISYFIKGLELCNKINHSSFMIKGYNGMSVAHRNLGDMEQANHYARLALDLSRKIGERKTEATALGIMAHNFKQLGQQDSALSYELQSLFLYEKIGERRNIGESKIALGGYYRSYGKYELALDYCKQGLEVGKKLKSVSLKLNACNCLYKVYKQQGQNRKALFYHELVLAFADTIEKDKTAQKLQQIEFSRIMLADSLEQEEEKLRMQIGFQEEINKESRTRNIAIASALIIFIFAGGLYNRFRFVRKSKRIIEKEKDRSENLLLNILPADIAAELKEKGKADARDFDLVSILFTDFKGFTEQSAKLSASELVNEINHCFEAFDGIMEKYGIEKIKTIGDAYMAAGGLPVPSDDSVKNTVLAALEMQAFITSRKAKMDAAGKPAFEMRVGIHTGPVVAGIVGVKKFQYDIWGDTVNTASRMESAGEVGKVNISQVTYELLAGTEQPAQSLSKGSRSAEFEFESRGKIEAKGKGEMEMFFVANKNGN